MLQARKEIWPTEYSCVVGLAVIQYPTTAEPKRFPTILFLSLLVAVRPVPTTFSSSEGIPRILPGHSCLMILMWLKQ